MSVEDVEDEEERRPSRQPSRASSIIELNDDDDDDTPQPARKRARTEAVDSESEDERQAPQPTKEDAEYRKPHFPCCPSQPLTACQNGWQKNGSRPSMPSSMLFQASGRR